MQTNNIFSISKSIMTPAQMQPCSPELLNAAMDDPQVRNACRKPGPIKKMFVVTGQR